MKTLGTTLIQSAAQACGATDKMVQIDWKADRIVVTVDVFADEEYVARMDEEWLSGGGEDDYEEEEEVIYDVNDADLSDDDFVEMWDNLDDDDFDEGDYDDGDDEEEEPTDGSISLTAIARKINEYLAKDGEDTLAFRIAQLHEIEVTTPEFDNVIRGERMFESYKGFDVIVEHWEEPKKKKSKAAKEDDDSSEEEEEEKEDPPKKLKVTEGKLVARDAEKGTTNVNVKGRIMKIKNDAIESVKLPKAKREKGAK